VQHGARSCRSISAADSGAQQQTRRPPMLLSTDGTDRRTDGRTDGRTPDCCIDPAARTIHNTIQYNTKFVKRHVAVASFHHKM